MRGLAPRIVCVRVGEGVLVSWLRGQHGWDGDIWDTLRRWVAGPGHAGE